MQSKNKPAMTPAERAHVERVKLLPCSCCNEGGGEGAMSECHEIEQGLWWLSIALCADCHRGSFAGLHGQKRAWAVRKMTENKALAVTIQRLMVNAELGVTA
jgi:hypothetical protein